MGDKMMIDYFILALGIAAAYWLHGQAAIRRRRQYRDRVLARLGTR